MPGRRHQSSPPRGGGSAHLGGADPGPQVVGGVEAGVHVGEVVRGRVPDAGRGGQPLLVALRRAAVRREAAPEVELEAELRPVAPEEQGVREARSAAFSAPPRRRARSARRASPARPRSSRAGTSRSPSARGRARGAGTRAAAPGSQPGVVQRVPGLVEERLVVVQPALRAGDQVHERAAGRTGSRTRAATSAAGPRDRVRIPGSASRSKPSARSVASADRERCAPSCTSPRAATAGGSRPRARTAASSLPLRAEQAVEPALALRA